MKRVSIRVQLMAGFLILLGGVCAGLGVIATRQATHSSLQQTEENIVLMAETGAKLIRSYLDYHLVALEAIANRNVIRSMDWTLQRPALEAETSRMHYLGMGVITPDGKAQYPDGKTASLGDRKYFQEAMTGKSVFSNVIISRVTNSPVIIIATPINNDAGKPQGVLIARLDATALSTITDTIRYGSSGYSYLIDNQGTIIAHPKRQWVLDRKNFLKEGKEKPEYAALAAMQQRMTRGESGADQYSLDGRNLFFGFAPVQGTGWSLAVGAVRDDVLAQVYTMRRTILWASALVFVAGILVAVLVSRAVLAPVKSCAHLLKDIAEGEGDLSQRLPVETTDELGQLAHYFNEFVEKLRNIIVQLTRNAHKVADSATELSTISTQTVQNVHHLSSKTASVSSATASMSDTIASVAQSMEETASNLSSVAAATEQMTATIGEIAGNTERARSVTENAASQVNRFAAVLEQLGEAAQEIGKVTETIAAISSQTNLLALNATIEAARAGEAGRGFAVVANEIKELAQKTATATQDIRDRIAGIQSASDDAVSDIGQIVRVIGEANSAVATIAAAIEEQSAVTRDVAQNIAQATHEVEGAKKQASAMSEAAQDISQEIIAVDGVTAEIRAGGDQVQGSAEKLAALAEELKNLVGQFRI